MKRLDREAEILASLNHPNIAAIYGLDDWDGSPALVMELVEGSTLADRIARGPIPVDEALSIARQIAEGLEYAHEKGVIHRDLKPGNVKITPDGVVKVLDFGLAKAANEPGLHSDPFITPTETISTTRPGLVIGTAAYMAPEQARGLDLDKRVDVWAFGVVLYEMLTGRRLFTGDASSDVLAAVLQSTPDWSVLPKSTPSRICTLLKRCLERDRKQRLRDIGEARIAIDEQIALVAVGVEGDRLERKGINLRSGIIALALVSLIVTAGVVGVSKLPRAATRSDLGNGQFPPVALHRFGGHAPARNSSSQRAVPWSLLKSKQHRSSRSLRCLGCFLIRLYAGLNSTLNMMSRKIPKESWYPNPLTPRADIG
jgi:serine/threonine protein kinase